MTMLRSTGRAHTEYPRGLASISIEVRCLRSVHTYACGLSVATLALLLSSFYLFGDEAAVSPVVNLANGSEPCPPYLGFEVAEVTRAV